MGQSLVKNFVHIVFSTKYQENLIDYEIENELFAYLGGVCNSLECFPIKVGGHRNHIHILCSLSKKVALAKLLEVVKASSSKWIKTKGKAYEQFYWQNGYGAFSVYPHELDRVVNYITNQNEHHTKRAFKKEYLAMLKKFNVEHDERYIWD